MHFIQPFPVTSVDGSRRQLSSQPYAELFVYVIRNLNAPRFTESRAYEANIDRDAPTGSFVAVVSATDSDDVVNFFFVNQ